MASFFQQSFAKILTVLRGSPATLWSACRDGHDFGNHLVLAF
jgi:hypothetical protein